MMRELHANLDVLNKRLWDAGLIDHVENQTLLDAAKALDPHADEAYDEMVARHRVEVFRFLRARGCRTLDDVVNWMARNAP